MADVTLVLTLTATGRRIKKARKMARVRHVPSAFGDARRMAPLLL